MMLSDVCCPACYIAPTDRVRLKGHDRSLSVPDIHSMLCPSIQCLVSFPAERYVLPCNTLYPSMQRAVFSRTPRWLFSYSMPCSPAHHAGSFRIARRVGCHDTLCHYFHRQVFRLPPCGMPPDASLSACFKMGQIRGNMHD